MRQGVACVNRVAAMAKEFELKLRGLDQDALRRALAAGGWSNAGTVLEVNHILDTPDGRLRAAGAALRVREVTSLAGAAPADATVTFKGPREPGVEKVREEIETAAADAAALLGIFERIDLRERLRYQKRRETWRRDDVEVVIDELPQLGGFVEIEAPTREAVRAIQRELHLEDATIEQRGYVELTARHGQRAADGVTALAFDQRSCANST